MPSENIIPAFGLYGEQDQFPDVIHVEDFSVRAPIHDWRILPHRHSQMSQLFLVTSGWIDATIDGRKYIVQAQDLLYIPEYCVHEFVFEPGSQGEIFSFPINVVQTVSPGADILLTTLTHPFVGKIRQPLERVIRVLRDSAGDASPFRAQLLTGLAHSVLAKLAEISLSETEPDQSPKDVRLLALDDLISENLSEAWSASDFAKALSISTGHLSRLCRTNTGLGAAAYIENRRMQEACRLLAFTRLPISEIGYRLGFQDPSYFSKRFRAVRNQTPMQYRALFTK